MSQDAAFASLVCQWFESEPSPTYPALHGVHLGSKPTRIHTLTWIPSPSWPAGARTLWQANFGPADCQAHVRAVAKLCPVRFGSTRRVRVGHCNGTCPIHIYGCTVHAKMHQILAVRSSPSILRWWKVGARVSNHCIEQF